MHAPPITSRYVYFIYPFGPDMIYIQNPDSSTYWQHDGKMRLYGSVYEMHENKQPTFVGMRQESAKFVLDTKISAFDFTEGDEAGLCVYQMHEGYVQCCVSYSRGNSRFRLRLVL